MDVKEYKERANEIAADMRYAAKDSLERAKEVSSMLGFKMADGLSALKQRVRESAAAGSAGAPASPGYDYQQQQQQQQYGGGNDYHDGGEAYRGSQVEQQQEQGQYSNSYDDNHAYGGSRNADYPPYPQSEAAAAVYNAVEHAFNGDRGGGDDVYFPAGSLEDPLHIVEESTATTTGSSSSSMISSTSADSSDSVTQEQYENIYHAWGGGVSAEQQDERYADAQQQLQQQDQQQWYPDSALEEAAGGAAALAGEALYTSYYSDSDSDSDSDAYAGILEKSPSSSSSSFFSAMKIRKGLRGLQRTATRTLGLKRRTVGGLASPSTSTSTSSATWASSDMQQHLEPSLRSSGSDQYQQPTTPTSCSEAMVVGSRANVQVLLAAAKASPLSALLLVATLAALPMLFILSVAGVPAAIRQLVMYSTSGNDGSGGGVDDTVAPTSFPGASMVRTGLALFVRITTVVNIPRAPVLVSKVVQIVGALEATPTCVVVLLLVQRIAVLVMTVVPALLSSLERAAGNYQRQKRESARSYSDPLDSAVWTLVGKLRFQRVASALSLVYLPLVVALGIMLVTQGLTKVQVYSPGSADGGSAPIALPKFALPLQVAFGCMVVESVFALSASLKQHTSSSRSRSPLQPSTDSHEAFPSLMLVLMLNSFVRTGYSHVANGGQPWTILPPARRLLSVEIRRARRLLDLSSAAVTPTDSVNGNNHDDGSSPLYRPYSHSPIAVSRRGMYSLAVFSSTLLTTAAALRLLARHDTLVVKVIAEGASRGLQLPLDCALWLLNRMGSSLFAGLSDSPGATPVGERGWSYTADRGLYLGINILLTLLALVPITMWSAFGTALLCYQSCDDELLAIAAAVRAPIGSSSSSSSGGGDSGPVSTSFRAVLSGEGAVKAVGRVNLHDARAILEAVALEDEYRSDM
jgi:hypothetical protein